MLTKQPSLSERAEISFSKLKSIASDLNQISDEMNEPVARINEALKGLNLGITAWVTIIRKTSEGEEFFEDHELGYAKVSGKWGIALRVASGEFGGPTDKEEWLFGDAPRWLRIEGVAKLPELLEQVGEYATENLKKVRSGVATAKQLADRISAAASPSPAAASTSGGIRKLGGGK
jgi:hypothetical protein